MWLFSVVLWCVFQVHKLYRYLLNDFEMVPVAPVIPSINSFSHSTLFKFLKHFGFFVDYISDPLKLRRLLIIYIFLLRYLRL